ncbi:type III restriction-modification system endonuclease [Sporolactobacillus terrae]|uniref:type III restriction-modification system endonuclease n=1 Tax=Sporolactobacillus terrae TaxID=269673 RepID=UPI0011198043|nr:DEAD/DEAH box helicase family protein [Sporolactobacillus terrae]
MKLQFEPNLDYQRKAVDSVVNLFEGQEIKPSNFTVVDNDPQGKLLSEHGIGNKLKVNEEKLLRNLQGTQIENGLIPDESLKKNDLQFEIEMETGTGKTYVYLRSILELNRTYGFTKFVIVVPSIAIKEGVNKTVTITKDHFRSLFQGVQYESFIYDSANVEQVRNFAVSDCVEIMIINIDAFRRSFTDPSKETKANIIHRKNDRLGGLKPIELIAETNPIVIIDEPQSVDTTSKAHEAIQSLNPLCLFKYSATHRDIHHLLYKLGPVEAYEQKLVKQIEVASVRSEDDFNGPYIKLLETGNKRNRMTARLELNVRRGSTIGRREVTVRQGTDLAERSRNPVYENYIVKDISCRPGQEYIDFTSQPVVLHLNQDTGGMNDVTIKRIQIRKTIEEHLDKELVLNPKGIKVLSLFFIDRVANYRGFDQDGNWLAGKYAKMFEEEYKQLMHSPKYQYSRYREVPVADVHKGYFSADKKHSRKGSIVWKDSSGKTQADDDTYNLIMKDKEELLRLNQPVRFIFSHSALREGWDNPNVFQICTLNETKSKMKKRQEIGRGLRLAVNHEGNRTSGFEINTLTIMANESYEQFAKSLQTEIEEETGIRFGHLSEDVFAGIVIRRNELDEPELLGKQKSEQVFTYLKDQAYINGKGKIEDTLKEAIKEKTLTFPEEFSDVQDRLVSVIKEHTKDYEIKKRSDRHVAKVKEKILENEDFRHLWDRIKYRTRFSVHFDSDQLISACAAALKEKLSIPSIKLRYEKGEASISKAGVVIREKEKTYEQHVDGHFAVPDIITFLQNETELTRHSLVRILKESETLYLFKRNPQLYMGDVAKIINSTKRSFIVDGITYRKIGDNAYYSQELFKQKEFKGYLKSNMILVEDDRSPYDYIVYDSDTERRFAEDCAKDPNVKMFVKLPDWFKIHTPLGNYNPDWAVSIVENGNENFYFIAETKENILSESLRPTEQGKIRCGKKHFEALGTGVKLKETTNLKNLFN